MFCVFFLFLYVVWIFDLKNINYDIFVFIVGLIVCVYMYFWKFIFDNLIGWFDSEFFVNMVKFRFVFK